MFIIFYLWTVTCVAYLLSFLEELNGVTSAWRQHLGPTVSHISNRNIVHVLGWGWWWVETLKNQFPGTVVILAGKTTLILSFYFPFACWLSQDNRCKISAVFTHKKNFNFLSPFLNNWLGFFSVTIQCHIQLFSICFLYVTCFPSPDIRYAPWRQK